MLIKAPRLLLLSTLLFLLPHPLLAKPQPTDTRVIVAPDCLIKSISYKTLSTVDRLSLIEVTNEDVQQLQIAKSNHQTLCGGFIDVTNAWKEFNTHPGMDTKSFLKRYTVTETHSHAAYKINYQDTVKRLLKQMNPQNLWSDLTTLSNFQNRNAKTLDGVKAANWIKEQVETLARNNHREDVQVNFIETRGYKQPSVVAKLGNGSEPGIVIGAHMDTISMFSSRQPGADDDGSGSVTVLETARTLLSSGLQFKKPIYFIWYAAEEEGLIGSQAVVAKFKNQIPVAAVLHMDMTGYAPSNDPTMWLIQDYVNKDLTTYLKTLIDTYVQTPVDYTRCGYACSDHATWTNNGFNAAIAFEAKFGKDNPDIHSSRDTIDKLSLKHMESFAKLSIAFVVELAEPIV